MPHEPGGKVDPKAQRRGSHTPISEPPPKLLSSTHLPTASSSLCPGLGGDDRCYLSPPPSVAPSRLQNPGRRYNGGTLEMKGMWSKKGSTPTLGSCPLLRPQPPLIPKPGSTASCVWWGPATSKHPSRATNPRLTGSQENPMQGQRKEAGDKAWVRHALSLL